MTCYLVTRRIDGCDKSVVVLSRRVADLLAERAGAMVRETVLDERMLRLIDPLALADSAIWIVTDSAVAQ